MSALVVALESLRDLRPALLQADSRFARAALSTAEVAQLYAEHGNHDFALHLAEQAMHRTRAALRSQP